MSVAYCKLSMLQHMSYRAGESLISTSAVNKSCVRFLLPLFKAIGGGAVTFAAGDGRP